MSADDGLIQELRGCIETEGMTAETPPPETAFKLDLSNIPAGDDALTDFTMTVTDPFWCNIQLDGRKLGPDGQYHHEWEADVQLSLAHLRQLHAYLGMALGVLEAGK